MKSKLLLSQIVLMIAACLIIAECRGKHEERIREVIVEEIPDTIYRPWDKVKDDTFYEIDEDKRFNIENNDGSIFIYGVNEDGKSVTIYGGNPNGIETMVIPTEIKKDDMRYKVTHIAEFAFASFDNDSIIWTKGVKSIVIEEGIETSGIYCFEYCPDLETVSIPASMKNLAAGMFSDCPKLAKVIIPDDSQMLEIEDAVFMNCCRLTDFEIPKHVTKIGAAPWKNCKSLRYISVAHGNVDFKSPDGVLYTFRGGKLIQYPAGKREKNYKVASGTREIYNAAFMGNAYIEKVEFPSSLEEISHIVFGDCTALKEVKFNKELRYIGKSVLRIAAILRK